MSGLHAILKKAKPANSYVEADKDQAKVCSASYDSADILCLSMEQATAELDTGVTAKPIFIKRDTTTRDLMTIEICLQDLADFETVTVQDLSRRRDEASGMQWPTDEVIARFQAGSKSPEELPPINLLDLDCTEPNAMPECFGSRNMQFLSKLKAHAGRPTENLNSLWAKVDKWRLLGQRGSGTMTHQDHCGFWTWVKVEEGKKLWLICRLSEDDRKSFARDGVAFTGGRWFYIWLEPGDILIMPPGTVHAVFTPIDTLCIGGNAWSQRRMGDSMRSIAFEDAYPNVTNDDEVVQLPDLLKEISRRVKSASRVIEFGGEEQIKRFDYYYEVYAAPVASGLLLC
jgi:hypothetical protein